VTVRSPDGDVTLSAEAIGTQRRQRITRQISNVGFIKFPD
jgi:hypothetical protein